MANYMEILGYINICYQNSRGFSGKEHDMEHEMEGSLNRCYVEFMPTTT